MSRHAYCIFCDDARLEVGNKTSLMGIYNGILKVPELPTILPKLCVSIFCSTPVERRFGSFQVRISIGNNILFDHLIPHEHFDLSHSEICNAESGSDEPIETLLVGMNAIISPLVIERESIIKVVVIADGEEITAGKLRIRQDAPSLN